MWSRLEYCMILFFVLLTLFDLYSTDDCPEQDTVFAQQGPKFISSPNHPGFYGALGERLSCSWIIRADPKFDDVVIQIEVLNSSMEPSTGCLRDSVLVVDGTRFFHPPLTLWCGDKVPSNTIVSTGPAAFVRFSTDFTKNDYTGFTLAYWVAKRPKLVVNVQPWTKVNYILLGFSIVLISALILSFVIIGIIRSWEHYQQILHDEERKKYM